MCVLSLNDDSYTRRVIEDMEHAMYNGERVSIASKHGPNIYGYVTSATSKSFTVENDGKKQRVRIADVLFFDFPDL
jgi:hypothetical protein|tara:strand:+ start:2471 stop:2698 length:228 start_codon:yes stop_codon:yes gene_type:complete